ncbi:MAG: hypothetical protein AB1758_14215 [Candidatus Eremiobacterota bacterium]
MTALERLRAVCLLELEALAGMRWDAWAPLAQEKLALLEDLRVRRPGPEELEDLRRTFLAHRRVLDSLRPFAPAEYRP